MNKDGWKYLAINVTPKEHAEITDWLDYICLNTGLTKKKVMHIYTKNNIFVRTSFVKNKISYFL